MNKDNQDNDKEFEDFLRNVNSQRNDDDPGYDIQQDQKRLMLDIIGLKLNSAVDLLNTLPNLALKAAEKDLKMRQLINNYENAHEQLDYLLSVLMDEMSGDTLPPEDEEE